MKILIMAGGEGERLWPLSRKNCPKQFHHLLGEKTLLQTTVSRFLAHFSPKDIYVLTNPDMFHLVKLQLAELHLSLEDQVIIEPEKKGTAPAISLAMKFFQTQEETAAEDCFLCCSSDVYMYPEETFLSAIPQAKELALDKKLVLFGVSPYSVKTEYGYIKVKNGHEVDSFIEKPKLSEVRSFIENSDYLWNCGIVLFTIETFFEELAHCAPDIFSLLRGSYTEATRKFHHMPSISIDYALLEKSQNISVVPLHILWSDLGSWENIYELSSKDSEGNVAHGAAFFLEAKNNLILSEKRSVIASFVSELVVIDTEDVLFVGHRSATSSMKEMVRQLKSSNRADLFQCSNANYHSWGFIKMLHQEKNCKISKVHIYAGEKLRLHSSDFFPQEWTVLEGKAMLTDGKEEKYFAVGERLLIDQERSYYLENVSTESLEMIITQVGAKIKEPLLMLCEDFSGEKVISYSLQG